MTPDPKVELTIRLPRRVWEWLAESYPNDDPAVVAADVITTWHDEEAKAEPPPR